MIRAADGPTVVAHTVYRQKYERGLDERCNATAQKVLTGQWISRDER